jgi:hypothetical protein
VSALTERAVTSHQDCHVAAGAANHGTTGIHVKKEETQMTIALFARQEGRTRPVSEIALLIGVSAGGLILSLILAAITWTDGSVAGPFVGP